MAYNNPIVLSYKESLLRLSDAELLAGPYWLNDTIISFYFEYLEDCKYHGERNMLFVSPQVTQCIKLSPASELSIFMGPLESDVRNFIFFALNDNEETEVCGGSHWSLLVYSYPEQKCFHFDSSRGANHEQAQMLGHKILNYLQVSTYEGVVEMSTLQQNNGYDCGIHVLAQVELIADYVRIYHQVQGCPLLDRETAETKRDSLLNLVNYLRRGDNRIM